MYFCCFCYFLLFFIDCCLCPFFMFICICIGLYLSGYVCIIESWNFWCTIVIVGLLVFIFSGVACWGFVKILFMLCGIYLIGPYIFNLKWFYWNIAKLYSWQSIWCSALDCLRSDLKLNDLGLYVDWWWCWSTILGGGIVFKMSKVQISKLPNLFYIRLVKLWCM